MSRPVLEIKNLSCSVDHKEILHGINLTVRGGEIHVIMGPNGTGKSTLASTLMGHPSYKVNGGQALLNGEDLLAMPVDERARKGLFLAMQYPAEIQGVTNADFMRTAMNAKLPADHQIGVFPFRKALNQAVSELEMDASLPDRYLNEGFSGGEKKRNEILQMKLLKPAVAILDEIDSGLDIDALRIVGQNVTRMAQDRGEEMGLLLITHYQRLLDYIVPDYVHVIMNGRVVRTGDKELAEKLERDGYEWLRQEAGLEAEPSGSETAADLLSGLPL
ncbi:Fe-S cluster assembly ATPase SufC [Oscillospiraceae bacterium HV4-5-C5C]|nr:Fe-S cluster assembly ATPase SufC [Oscillospiraceae bacterium HV4-5-C5C]